MTRCCEWQEEQATTLKYTDNLWIYSAHRSCPSTCQPFSTMSCVRLARCGSPPKSKISSDTEVCPEMGVPKGSPDSGVQITSPRDGSAKVTTFLMDVCPFTHCVAAHFLLTVHAATTASRHGSGYALNAARISSIFVPQWCHWPWPYFRFFRICLNEPWVALPPKNPLDCICHMWYIGSTKDHASKLHGPYTRRLIDSPHFFNVSCLRFFFDYISALPRLCMYGDGSYLPYIWGANVGKKTSRMKWSVIFGRWAAGGSLYMSLYFFWGVGRGRMSASQILLIKFGVRQLRSVWKTPFPSSLPPGLPVPQGGHHSLPTRFGRTQILALGVARDQGQLGDVQLFFFFCWRGVEAWMILFYRPPSFQDQKLGRFAKVSNIHSRAGNRDAELVAIFKETTKSLAIVLNLEVSALIPKEPASWSPEVHHANHLFDRSVVTSFTTMF